MTIQKSYFYWCIVNILQIVLLLFVNLLEDNILKEYSYFLLILHYFLGATILIFVVDKSYLLFSPSYIAFTYITLSMLFGSYLFGNGLVSSQEQLLDFNSWEYYNISLSYLIVGNVIVLSSLFVGRNPFKITINTVQEASVLKDKQQANFWLYACIILLGVTYYISYFSFFGTFEKIVYSFIAINIVYVISTKNSISRIIIYGLIIYVFMIISVYSKRAAISFFLTICFVEFIKDERIFKTAKLITGFIIVIFMLASIFVMSISRGYGNYNSKNIYTSAQYLWDYINKSKFLVLAGENTEASFLFYNSNKAIEYIIDEPSRATLGSTILKASLIWLPRSIFPEKPDSIIKKYTDLQYPGYWEKGGSLPINLYSEFFWNFHLSGVFILGIIFIIFNKIYDKLVKSIRNNNAMNNMYLLFMFHYFLTYVRGSGLDIYFIYGVIGFILTTGYMIPTVGIMKSIFQQKLYSY
jgi:hypothetical protein